MTTHQTPEQLDELEKLRRLSELELSKPGALTPGGFHARNKYTTAIIERADSLLSAARELERLKAGRSATLAWVTAELEAATKQAADWCGSDHGERMLGRQQALHGVFVLMTEGGDRG